MRFCPEIQSSLYRTYTGRMSGRMPPVYHVFGEISACSRSILPPIRPPIRPVCPRGINSDFQGLFRGPFGELFWGDLGRHLKRRRGGDNEEIFGGKAKVLLGQEDITIQGEDQPLWEGGRPRLREASFGNLLAWEASFGTLATFFSTILSRECHLWFYSLCFLNLLFTCG